ncbi:MAG TPA: response regulator transcription factor [Luteimonas sp.]|nr:response regulator transcription factor [Luteimonas sp.]
MSEVAPHLLVIDDDAEIGAMLTRYFVGHGYRVTVAEDGAQSRACLRSQDIDLVLLDLGLPDGDGLSLLRDFQAFWMGPVIVVSGRGESIERVVGLELGADDYVSKPFDLRELLARVRSVLRRAQSYPTLAGAAPNLDFDGLRLETESRRLLDREGVDIGLTSGEFDLLLVLLSRPNQVLTRDELMNSLHGREAGPYDRSIDVQIGRLRRKIEPDPGHPSVIKSVRGAGYMLAAHVSAG